MMKNIVKKMLTFFLSFLLMFSVATVSSFASYQGEDFSNTSSNKLDEKKVDYKFWPLTVNLVKLMIENIASSGISLTKCLFEIVKRVPTSFWDCLTGYKSNKILELQKRLDICLADKNCSKILQNLIEV